MEKADIFLFNLQGRPFPELPPPQPQPRKKEGQERGAAMEGEGKGRDGGRRERKGWRGKGKEGMEGEGKGRGTHHLVVLVEQDGAVPHRRKTKGGNAELERGLGWV